MKVVKRILKILADIVIILIFAASIFVIISSITQKKNGVSNVFGYTSAVVQTDSMTGTLEKGDIVISKLTDADTEIKKNDIVSFFTDMDGERITITHRVVEAYEQDGIEYYQTQGDKPGLARDEYHLVRSEILSKYCFRIPFAGKVIEFVKKPLGFVLCLVIPMSAFIIYQVIKLIKLYVESKKLQPAEGAPAEPSDDMKEAIIQEYLASLGKEEKGHEKKPEDDDSDDNKEDSADKDKPVDGAPSESSENDTAETEEETKPETETDNT